MMKTLRGFLRFCNRFFLPDINEKESQVNIEAKNKTQVEYKQVSSVEEDMTEDDTNTPEYKDEISRLEFRPFINQPFDVIRTLSNEIELFGPRGESENIGRTAQYVGEEIDFQDEDTNANYQVKDKVGIIVGDLYGRYILQVDEMFFGWVNKEDIRILDIQTPDWSYIM